MSILRSDNLKDLVIVEDYLKNEHGGLCDPTIEDVECKDNNITDVILKIIKDNSIQSTLNPGVGISISNDTINVRPGAGIIIDPNNNITIDTGSIKSPINGNVTTISNTGEVNVNIGGGLVQKNNTIAIDYGSLPLVVPELFNSIKEYNNDKTTLLRTLTANSVTIEDGSRIDVDSKFKYTLGSNYSAPTAITGDYGTIIPNDNVYSSSLIISDYLINSGNLSKTVTFTRPKSGLNVVNGKVVEPTGNDSTSALLSISINYPFYLGYSSSTPSSITSFTKKLSLKSGSLTYTGVTSGVSNYTYFLFPNDVTVTNIIMDGAAPVLGAFTQLSNVNIITDTGVTRSMKVLKSNALGAFNNNTLRFDFHN